MYLQAIVDASVPINQPSLSSCDSIPFNLICFREQSNENTTVPMGNPLTDMVIQCGSNMSNLCPSSSSSSCKSNAKDILSKKIKREPICNFSVEKSICGRIVIKCLQCGSKYNHEIRDSWIICSNNNPNAKRPCTNMSNLYLEKIKPEFEEKNKEFEEKIKHNKQLKHNKQSHILRKLEDLGYNMEKCFGMLIDK